MSRNSEPSTTSDRIRAALADAEDFLSVDDICQAVFGHVGTRERSTVYVAIHRMGDEVEKRAAGYRRKA